MIDISRSSSHTGGIRTDTSVLEIYGIQHPRQFLARMDMNHSLLKVVSDTTL